METKDKRRPAGKKRRKAPPAAAKQNRRRKPAANSADRRPRPAMDEQLPAAAQPVRPLQTDAPEMVFTPGRQTGRNRASEDNSLWSSMQRNSAARSKKRVKERRRRGNRPSVVYTQPAPMQLSRIALYLVSMLAVVLAVFLGISVFFKVKTVKVYGNKAYSAWTVREASGIEDGENLLTLGRTRASGKIITALPYVKNARIGIKLPDTVNIYIEEEDVAYSVRADNGSWWLMTSKGRVVEQIDTGRAGNYTKVLGIRLESPAEGEQAKALEEEIPVETTAETQATEATISIGETLAIGDLTVPEITTAADKLEAALTILTELENNDIVGEAASIDVTSLVNIELWYGQRYRVKLGDLDRMDYKISCMKQAVSQLQDYQSGVLDVTFVTWTDQLGFTPME